MMTAKRPRLRLVKTTDVNIWSRNTCDLCVTAECGDRRRRPVGCEPPDSATVVLAHGLGHQTSAAAELRRFGRPPIGPPYRPAVPPTLSSHFRSVQRHLLDCVWHRGKPRLTAVYRYRAHNLRWQFCLAWFDVHMIYFSYFRMELLLVCLVFMPYIFYFRSLIC